LGDPALSRRAAAELRQAARSGTGRHIIYSSQIALSSSSAEIGKVKGVRVATLAAICSLFAMRAWRNLGYIPSDEDLTHSYAAEN
jgi:hypothetical protein